MYMARTVVMCEEEAMPVNLALLMAAIDKESFPREESPTQC